MTAGGKARRCGRWGEKKTERDEHARGEKHDWKTIGKGKSINTYARLQEQENNNSRKEGRKGQIERDVAGDKREQRPKQCVSVCIYLRESGI